MEFSINIKFNDYLTKNENSTITYSGALFKNGSESVTIVYGFGDNWSNTTEQLMEKTSDGFVAEIKILDFEKFNFCFRNANYEWDNNNNQNYISPILDEKTNDSFIINEDIITPILENLMEDLPAEEIALTNNETELESTVETISEIETTTYDENALSFNIEIEENIIENNTRDTNDIPAVDEQTVSKNIEKIQDIEKIFDELYQLENSSVEETTVLEIEDNASIEETKIENISIENTQEDDTQISDKQILLDDILSSNSQTTNEEKSSNFNMNSLIDEILSPIVKSSIFETELESEPVTFFSESTIVNEETTTQVDAPITFDNSEENDEKVDSLITNLISDLQANLDQNAETENIIEENIEETEKTSSTETNKNEENNDISSTTNEVINSSVTTGTVEQTLNEVIEESLIDVLNNDNKQKAETTNTETGLIVSPRALNKFYLFKKKVKVAVCKIFSIIPKILSADKNENN